MKTILAFVVAAACSALLISSANAGGGRRQGGMSSSSTSSGLLPNGRSPLGEPVFLIPSSSKSSGGPIGGYVPPTSNTASLVGSSSASTGATSSARVAQLVPSSTSTALTVPSTNNGNGHAPSFISSGAGTNVIFTPPPTIVGVAPQVTATGNIAGNNLAADKPFGGSILNTGLGSGHTGSTSQDQSNGIRITPLINAGPTVQVPTATSTSNTTTSAATTSGR
jgi:hypothetical protein